MESRPEIMKMRLESGGERGLRNTEQKMVISANDTDLKYQASRGQLPHPVARLKTTCTSMEEA